MAPDTGSHGCLTCLNCLQASRLTPEQIDGWRQTFSGPHDCPALRFVPAWVIHCIVAARQNSIYEGKPKLASELWNLEIVPWIVVPRLSTNKTSWVDHNLPGLWISIRKIKMSTSRRVRCPPTDVMRPYSRPLGGRFVRPGTPSGLAIFRLPEWSSCWAFAVGPVHSTGKACASGLTLLLFLAQTKVCP